MCKFILLCLFLAPPSRVAAAASRGRGARLAYIAAHALFSVEGYCAAALSLRYEAVMLVWVSLIFISNINSAFNFYRASVDESYSPGNKLISGLRDSAVSWAIILPLYWYCEKGAAAA